MPFAAPLNWPLTLLWATLTLFLITTFIWWVQLPSLPCLTSSPPRVSPLWNW